MLNFADRIVAAQRTKNTIVVLGVDPQLDSDSGPGIPSGYSLSNFCCEIVQACEPFVVAIKPQLAFFEARGLDGMRALVDVLQLAGSLGLLTIADAKRGDIGSTSSAYAEAFLGEGEGDFRCDAMTLNLYQGSDTIAPFFDKVRKGRGIFVCVKTSNKSSVEFQDLGAPDQPLWKSVAERVREWGNNFVGVHDLTPVGAVFGATYPEDAHLARQIMPNSLILVPGYGTQGASAGDAVACVRRDGLGTIVNASRSLMYAFKRKQGASPGAAAAEAAAAMQAELNRALRARLSSYARISSASSAARVA